MVSSGRARRTMELRLRQAQLQQPHRQPQQMVVQMMTRMRMQRMQLVTWRWQGRTTPRQGQK